MARRRRTAAEAKAEILAAAQDLLLKDGPDALRLELIARETGMTHPNILHHFGSMESLREALHRHVSLELRTDMLGLLEPDDDGQPDLAVGLREVFQRIADPDKGRLLAWVVAEGLDPWPPSTEYGMSGIADKLAMVIGIGEARRQDVNNVVFMAFMCMVGEAIAGASVRSRFRPESPVSSPDEFRDWMISGLGKLLRP